MAPMTTRALYAAIILAIIAFGLWYVFRPAAPALAPSSEGASYKDATYTIEGQPVSLVAGNATTSSAITRYFGNDATGDLNGDGIPDAAFILTQDTGGSGTFYYVVAAIKTHAGYLGTNAVLLGDRIAPQSTQIEYGELVVNYADRNAGEPMTTPPSVGVSKYLVVKGGQLFEIPSNEYAAGNLLLGTSASTKLGTYLAGSSGMTLYVSNKDAAGISNCSGTCAGIWLPYIIATTSALGNIQTGITGLVGTIARTDGSLQVSYNDAPLYYYVKDAKPSDTLGQGVNNQWFVVKVTLGHPTAGAGQRCGGNMTNAPVCTSGYHCAPEPGSHLPFGDVGGVCVAN